mgnify:CR=1 FL=1
MAQAIDFFVDRRFFFDVGIGLWDIGFRLVVVVVRDKVMDRVVREKLLELAV